MTIDVPDALGPVVERLVKELARYDAEHWYVASDAVAAYVLADFDLLAVDVMDPRRNLGTAAFRCPLPPGGPRA